jgi:hypothetical protein
MSLKQNNDVRQQNVLEYGKTKFPENLNTPGSDTHRRDLQVGNSVLSFRLRNISQKQPKTFEKFEEGFM